VARGAGVETNVPVLINPPPVGHVMPYSTVRSARNRWSYQPGAFQEGRRSGRATCCLRLTNANAGGVGA